MKFAKFSVSFDVHPSFKIVGLEKCLVLIVLDFQEFTIIG